MNTFDKLHIISGGPGSGKSSLLAALQRDGYKTMPEAGRAIIQDQVAIGGTALLHSQRYICGCFFEGPPRPCGHPSGGGE